MSRKDRLLRNLGAHFEEDSPKAEPYFDGPLQAETRTSVVMVERILRGVLDSEISRLSDRSNTEELRRYFSHFYDPTVGAEERERFVTNFQRNPPRATIGYPRVGADLPLFSIVLVSDEELDGQPSGFLGKYAGETLPGEVAVGGEDAEYEGGYFNQMFSVFVYGQNPDQVAYLWQFVKLTLYGARQALEATGLIDPRYSGGELSPEEMYLPDNVFARVLNIRVTTMMTVPRLFGHRDGRKLRLTGIFRDDVVVEGVRGGVKTYTEE